MRVLCIAVSAMTLASWPARVQAQGLGPKRTLTTGPAPGCAIVPAGQAPVARRDNAEARRLATAGQEAALIGDQPAARITGSLDLIELDVAVRLRFAPTPTPGRCLTLGAGGMLLRSNERLPPDDRRSYLGPFGELGYEHLAYGSFTATFHLRLGPVATGPTILSGLLGIGIAM